MNKKILLFAFFFVISVSLVFAYKAFAHSGGTDADGCHHNRQANPNGPHYKWDWDYHCH
jgi:hypothetical protein